GQWCGHRGDGERCHGHHELHGRNLAASNSASACFDDEIARCVEGLPARYIPKADRDLRLLGALPQYLKLLCSGSTACAHQYPALAWRYAVVVGDVAVTVAARDAANLLLAHAVPGGGGL